MSKRDIIVFLFKWKNSLIGYFLLVVVAVSALVYILPAKYASSALVLIESNRAPTMRSDVAYGADATSVLNSEVAIIKSRTVLASAVDNVGSAEDPEQKKEPSVFSRLMDWFIEVGLTQAESPREAMIENLESNLKVSPLPASNIITISLTDKNPAWLTKIVNEVTDNYIQHHLKIYSSPGPAEVYRRQADRLGQELKKQRQELEDYKRKTDVTAIKESMTAYVREQSSLNAELQAANQDLAELQTLFTPGHPKVTLAEEKIANIKRSLDETKAKLQELDINSAKIDDLEVDIHSTEKSFLDYQKRYEEARLTDLANPEVVNVRVVEYAAVPTSPTHSRLFYIALSLLGGMVLSLAIAIIKEYFDHRVSDPDAIEKILGVPVLGSIEKDGLCLFP